MLDKMAVANYSGRLQDVFRINNFNYIVCQFKALKEQPILKEDLKVFEDSQESFVGSFITLTLKEHFPAMMSALDSDSANAKLLEQAVSDFAFCYKQKADLIGKELKNSVQEPDVASQIGNKMMRTICFKYGKLMEACKAASVSASGPTSNQVLLDLTNSGLRL